MKNNNKNNKKKRRKKKKLKKSFVSAAAFILAAAVVVFCIYHVVYKTDFFMLKGVDVEGLVSYNKDYITEKAGIEMGRKIFTVDKEYIKEVLEQEIYIKNVKVLYELPDRLYIKVEERQESYQVFWNDKYIVTDEEGVVMNTYDEKSNLLTIESLTDVIYNIGDKIKFDGVRNAEKVFEMPEYINKYGDEVIGQEFFVDKDDSVLLNTDYGVRIKIDTDEDIGYQITFALNMISDRMANNMTVTQGDLIDFTRSNVATPSYVREENTQTEEGNG